MIKLVEEWGCNLVEDAFLLEEEMESRTEVLSNHNDAPRMEEVQGEMDELVDDLNKEWLKQDEKKDESGNGAANYMHDDVNCPAKSVQGKHGKTPIGSANIRGVGMLHGVSLNDISGLGSAKVEVRTTSKSKNATSSQHKKKKVGVALN